MRRPFIGVSALVVAFIAVLAPSATAATDEDVEQLKTQLKAEIDAEVGAVKKEYEGRIKALEKRINTLETDNAQLKHARAHAAPSPSPSPRTQVAQTQQNAHETSTEATPPPALEQQNAARIDELERKLREDLTETRDIYRDDAGWPFDATKLYDLPRPFEYHGYFRSGFGLNGDDGKMEAFKAPGAGAKYRLGNEADTYGEIGVTNNWLRADNPLQSPYVRTTAMLSYSTGQNFSFDSLNNQAQGNDIALRQAFVEAGNVIQSAPEVRFWAGQRYYNRYDININDFYYLDMSGYGGGVEAIPLGDFGKLSLAWLGGSVDNYMTDHGNAAKSNFDLRIYDVEALYGKFTLWLDYSHTRGGEAHNVFDPNGHELVVQTSSGFAIGLIHRTKDDMLFGGYNDFSIQYGNGAAYNFQSTLDTSGPHLDDAWRFRVTDHFTVQPVPEFAVQAVGIYEETSFGGPNSRQRWGSIGARPVLFLNDRFSLAFEAGIDWAESQPLGTDGHLWKLTFAPQISRGGKFFSRPTLRLFVTYAQWSNDFKGFVGGSAYEHATDGFSYGIQAEAWW